VISAGASLALFAASGPPNQAHVRRSVATLKSWGYRPVLGPATRPRLFLAGSDEERAAALVWALTDARCEAAWLLRGGYGLGRLLPHLPWEALRPRPLVGFSDGTALLWSLYRRGWTQLVHGPNVQGLAPHADEATRDATRELLAGHGAPRLRGRALVKGACQGPLVGGNLCVLASLCGTAEQFQGQGCIVFLEEVTEQPYRVDRLLTQLLNSGAFEGAVGIALGEFTACGSPRALASVVRERLGGLGLPVLTGLPCGHGPTNLPFVYGSWASLEGSWLTFSSMALA